MFQDSIVPNRSIGFETHDNTYFATVPCGVAAFDSGSDENTLFFCWIDDRRSLTVFITDSVGALFVYWGVVVFRNDLLDCFSLPALVARAMGSWVSRWVYPNSPPATAVIKVRDQSMFQNVESFFFMIDGYRNVWV